MPLLSTATLEPRTRLSLMVSTLPATDMSWPGPRTEVSTLDRYEHFAPQNFPINPTSSLTNTHILTPTSFYRAASVSALPKPSRPLLSVTTTNPTLPETLPLPSRALPTTSSARATKLGTAHTTISLSKLQRPPSEEDQRPQPSRAHMLGGGPCSFVEYL